MNKIIVEFLADAQKLLGKQYSEDWENYFYPGTTSLRVRGEVFNTYGLD